MIKYSIVLPVFNEFDNIQKLFENITHAMSQITNEYEAIFVDDGSKDGSREEIKKCCEKDPRFRYLGFDRNYGQTSAFDAGFRAAKGKIIVTMDADLQVDAHDIPRLLEKLDDYDVVVGYRQKRADNWIKKISSKIANAIRNRLSGEHIRDVGCPLKAFKKEALENVKFYEGMHRFFPTLFKLEGYRVAEVPIHHYSRQFGKSKYNVHNRVFKALRDLFAVRWMKSRYLHYQISERG